MKNKPDHWILTACRLLMGIVFILSSLSKAIDPIASGIKIQEYLISFGITQLEFLTIWLGALMNIAEFIIGFALLFKLKMKITSWALFLFMTFFLCLTAWLAVAEHLETNYGYNFGVVKDCGCFGQTIAMSNLQTFLKNVPLMLLTIPIFIHRNRWYRSKYHDLIQIMIGALGVIIIIIVQWISYINMPCIDFSDWKKGNNVADLYLEKPEEKQIKFIYRNNQDGSLHAYTTDEMTTAYNNIENFADNYEFVERKDSIISPLIHAKISGFTLLDTNGIDHAKTLLTSSDTIVLIFMYDLSKISEKAMSYLKDFTLRATSKYNIVGLTNSSFDDIHSFTQKNNFHFPILHNEIDSIKGPFIIRDAIRANPGVILVKDSMVIEKMSWRKLPKWN